MAEVKQLTRVFKMGSVALADPDKDMSPEDVLQMYSGSYPHLAAATLSEPHVEGDQLIYEVQKAPVKTKG